MPLADDLAGYFADHPLVELAFLFGSVGDGRAGFASDLDVAVMSGRAPLSAAEKTAMIDALASLSGRPVDLIDLRRTGGPLLGQVLHEGTRLYCESNARYAELLKRHVFDQADFAPYRQRLLSERRRRWIGNS